MTMAIGKISIYRARSSSVSEEIAAAAAVFTITPNPIINEVNEDAAASASGTTSTLASVKMLPDYRPAAEDATSSVVTPPEIALLQKRIQFRRMLPCLDFEDLERKRMEMDESRLAYLLPAHNLIYLPTYLRTERNLKFYK